MNLVKISSSQPRKASNSALQHEAELRRGIRAAKRTYGAEHPNTALAFLQMGDYFAHEHQHLEAESAYKSACEIYDALGCGHELLHAIALRSLAQAVCAQNRHQEGEALTARATHLIVNYQ